jgi:hypothetical protein
MAAVIPRRVVPSARPADGTTRQVEREFRGLLRGGARMRVAGSARRDPARLLGLGYTPKYRVSLFDTTYYLTNVRQNADIRFFVAYVVQDRGPGGATEIHPRIFYKDLSLVWRSASHFIQSAHENWVGKGDVKIVDERGEELLVSAEETTNLPIEIQTALETLSRRPRRIPHDEDALDLVLHHAPDDRIEPYRDFTEPRRRAAANPRNRVNGGRPIARFTRRNDPGSLVFARGFEPDFSRGVLETSESTSRLYRGRLRRFRILSRNRRVQYLFLAGPHQAWIGACQATTTDLTSYGVRSIDVVVPDDLLVPGYEYHFVDHTVDPPEIHSQIPEHFVGEPSRIDPSRSDASPWLERLPVIRRFRRRLLARPGRPRRDKPSDS